MANKIQPGSFPSAAEWNRHVDAVRDWTETKRLGTSSEFERGGFASYGTTVQLKNSSGSDIIRHRALGISGVAIDPTSHLSDFQRTPIFTGVTPASATHGGKWALTLEPIANGAVGRGFISGLTPAEVNITDTSHEFADIADAVVLLASGTSGSARILYQESGTGTKWCLLRMSNQSAGSSGQPKIGVLQGNLAGPPAQGILDLYEQVGTAAPSIISPSQTLTVMNFTSIGLKAGPLMKAEMIDDFDNWECFPAQIEGCLTPEYDPDNDAVNGGAVTATTGANVRYDPDGAGGAVTIEFPDTTLLQDGETFRTENVNKTSTTGITINANASSPSDELEDPSDRSAAYATSHAGVVTTRYIVDWQLDTNNYSVPTWKVANIVDS